MRLALVLSIGSALAVGVGCEEALGPPVREREKLSVVATIYPLADVARSIGGKRVNVSWLTESGQSLSAIPLEMQDRVGLADLVLARGTIDQWALVGANDSYQAQRFIRIDVLDGKATGEGHTWLDPDVITEFAGIVCQRLAAKDPEYEAYYRTNEELFVQGIEKLQEKFAGRLAAVRNRRGLCVDSGFEPLFRHFGLTMIPAVPTPTPKLTDDQIARIRKIAADQKLSVLFVPADRPPAVQRELAERTGLEVLLLDPLGSSAPASGRSTYEQILRYNLEQLEAGLNRRQ